MTGTKVSKEMVAIRVKVLKGMHQYLIEMGDEMLYAEWVLAAVPDEPSEEDFEFMAGDDELFLQACTLFRDLAEIDAKENY